MSRIIKSGQMVPSNRRAPRTRKRAARLERKQSPRRCSLRLEQLEDRVTPSILSTFELDGNAITGVLGTSGSTTTSHDWDQVFADNNAVPPPTSGALASSFLTDVVNSTTDDIFTGGGSKDTLGVQAGKWLFTASKPQGKDDITHAYAAAYTDASSGHLLLYAGLDRFDNSGDATAGFWFFQNPISENPSVTTNGGHPFTGTHADGDILLVSDFTTGGSVSTIKVFRWTGSDSSGSLVALNNGNPINGNTFAIVNGGPISVPWSYTNKSGATSPDHGEFLEEGVDLTALGLSGCFSTFLAETRSSQSPTATLSDFVVGSFPLCSIAAPQFAGLSKVGDSVTYPLTVENTGAQPLFLKNVTDTLLGSIVVNGVVQAPVAPVTNIDASALAANTPLAPGATLTIFVTRTVQATDPDPTPNTVTFVFNDKADFSGNVVSTSVSDSVNLFQPSATTTVTANPTSTSNPGQVITYTYTITNTSSSDSPNLVLDSTNQGAGDPNTYTDSLLGDLEADAIHAATGNNTATVASIAPGASFQFTETRAIQPTDPTTLTNTVNGTFTLAQNLGNFGNIIHASASSTVTLIPKIAAPGFTGISKIGDPATYALTVTNTGPVNVYVQNVSETLLGNIVVNGVVQAPVAPVTNIDASALGNGLLAAGQSVTIFVTRTVQAGEPDPTNSTVTFVYNSKADFSGVQATASASDSVNLFQPSATLTVSANPTSTSNPNQVITYTYTVTNTSSADSPNLVLDTSNPNDSFTDTLLGNLEADAIHAAAGTNTATVASIAPGASFSFTETRALQAGDPNTLTNSATVVFTLAQNLGNFSNKPSASASTSVTLIPVLAISKTVTGDGTSAVIHPGDTASFTITVSNTGAGAASGIVVTDQLPDPALPWTISSFDGFDSASLSSGDFLTANKATLAAGSSVSIIVSAVIPVNIFGPPPGTVGNGDPIPNGLFELDGDATAFNAAPPVGPADDWSNVLFGNGGSSADHASVTDVINSTSDNIFTGGGSKDISGIQQGPWLSTAGKPQGKDDIENAFAALYQAPPLPGQTAGDEILYTGLTRFDNSGDATAGFWFFVNAVGSTTGKSQHFSGTHTDGDILLISDFTIGGSVSTIAVYKWVGNDSTGSLQFVGGNSSNTKAIVNGANITLPAGFNFTNKSRTPGGVALPGEFLEEGVNLTSLGLSSCFSSFLAETRSSQSPSATLSDFALGNFNTCMLTLPNMAHLHANNPPVDVDSNQTLITVVSGGMPMLAASIGSTAAAAGLTDQQLQAVMAQAIDQWRAAGADPQQLAALEHQDVQVADLNHGELGWTLANHTWIDRTAEGWGWSSDGPAQGKMDLLTVVTHELGHVLQMPQSATGVMELALAPGMRLTPAAAHMEGAEALTGNTMVQVSQSGTRTGPGVRGPEAPVPLVTQPSRSTLISPTLSFEQTSNAVLGGVVSGQTGPVIVNRQASLTVGATAAPVDVSILAAPTAQSPAKRPDNGAGYDRLWDDDQDAATDWNDLLSDSGSVWDAGRGSAAASAGAEAGAGRQQARDAYFAQDNWHDLFLRHTAAVGAASEDVAPGAVALDPMLAAGLALILGGYVGTPRERFSGRDRRRFQV